MMKYDTFIYSTYFLSMFSMRFHLSNLFRSSPYWVPSAVFVTRFGCPFQVMQHKFGVENSCFLDLTDILEMVDISFY